MSERFTIIQEDHDDSIELVLVDNQDNISYRTKLTKNSSQRSFDQAFEAAKNTIAWILKEEAKQAKHPNIYPLGEQFRIPC